MLDPCDSCPVTEGACYARRINVRRLCNVPAYRPMLERLGTDGTPTRTTIERKPDPNGVSPCSHRSIRWNCGGECTMTCAIGKGQAGIIEADDCRNCEHASNHS